jgi:CheY-like chemotaxis protein
MTTLLHVEDDRDLSELVEDAFEGFGFHGAFVRALTVADAVEIMSDRATYPTIDLVISDMHLPDGTGLDVLRHLRTNPAREHVPALVLSGDTDPDTVSRAYALGANAFVPKHMRGRSELDVMRTIFEHWLKDVSLPLHSERDRTRTLIANVVKVRRRFGALFMSVIEVLGVDSPDADFWMNLALWEGNIANLFAFLVGQLGTRELPTAVLEWAERVQAQNLRTLREFEQHPVQTRQDANRLIRTWTGNLDAENAAHVISGLFPAGPAVIPTLREVIGTMVDNIASWIEKQSTDPALRDQIEHLRTEANLVRTSREYSGPD